MLVLHRYFSYLCIVKEKRRGAHGETACYYQRNGLLLKDRQGDDKRRQCRSPGREKAAIKREQNQASMLCRAKAASNEVQPIFKLTLKNF